MVQPRPPLIIHFDDMEPERYKCLSDSADDKRPLVTGRNGRVKVFYIKWLED